jgi:hypothetical protein
MYPYISLIYLTTKIMSIQISNLTQSDLLQDLTAADSSAVVGGHGLGLFGTGVSTFSPFASVSVPSVSFPGLTIAAPGTATGIGVTSFTNTAGGSIGTGVGFGSATGTGFTAASGSSSASGTGASANGGGFTGGIANPINVTFDRV